MVEREKSGKTFRPLPTSDHHTLHWFRVDLWVLVIRSVDTEKFRCYGKEIVTTEIVFGEDKVFEEDNQHCYAKTWDIVLQRRNRIENPSTTDLPGLQIGSTVIALVTLVVVIAINLPLGFLPLVDNSAHIEGFLSGFPLGLDILLFLSINQLNNYVSLFAYSSSFASITKLLFCNFFHFSLWSCILHCMLILMRMCLIPKSPFYLEGAGGEFGNKLPQDVSLYI
ncbi:rhomboid-like protein 2 [Quercus suber]|uniref:Rhomboid-like protein 2 n=1 Tax=Quercus suber TaxID=58331 RepID=A0AAW0JYX7_QUESU